MLCLNKKTRKPKKKKHKIIEYIITNIKQGYRQPQSS